ncbi:hypothetical protein CK203_045405 [Vitis vinifera]|uniref:Uncharacterized protein n=1 Tax=Vitis vinifera TaxID=29760 RepID=A0A438H916_VITVI|nr:hypothetical protein CK203_045405 [Vitis vinifera]
MTSEGEGQAASAPKRRLSCKTCIDNLWFCYFENFDPVFFNRVVRMIGFW